MRNDLATALEMPLFIVSYMYFFANCRKTRSLAGAIVGLVHNVQLLCKTGIRKAHLSTSSCDLLFWIAVKIPKCSQTHYNNLALPQPLGAINNIWWNITQKKCQTYFLSSQAALCLLWCQSTCKPDHTAIAHSCANVTKALLIASPLSIRSFSLRSCSTWKPDSVPDNCVQPARYL